jgi:hypothetical protein
MNAGFSCLYRKVTIFKRQATSKANPPQITKPSLIVSAERHTQKRCFLKKNNKKALTSLAAV